MLAMREGQPCLVHGVGGLKDTVIDGKSGFVFQGADLPAQALAMLTALEKACLLYQTPKWKTLIDHAKQQRFSWHHAAKAYATELYSL